jgi:type VI secretion system protein ImpK
LVAVLEDGQTVTVRIINKGKGIFASGSAELEPRYVVVIERVANALRDEAGPVQVIGHTDNVPIRTIRFPSNFHLSQERARSVAEMIKKRLNDPGRVTAEARADAEPIASNATPEGREQNRRIDLVLLKTSKS